MSKHSISKMISARLMITATIMCLSSIIQAQERSQVLDSMIRQWPSMKNDTNKVKHIFEIVRIYRRIQPDSALLYAHMELDLSNQLNFYWGIGKANNQIGLIHLAQHKFTDAYTHFLQASGAFDKINDLSNKITVYSNLSKVFSTQNKVDSALKYIHLTISLNNQLAVSEEKNATEIDALNDLSIVYYGLDKLDSVIYYNSQVIEKSNTEDLNEIKGAAFLTNAAAYQKLREHQKAIDNFRSADNLLLDPPYKIQILQGLGKSFYALNRLDSAINCNQLALNLCQKHGFENHVPSVLFNQGLAYLNKKETAKAISVLNECTMNKFADNILKAECYQFSGLAYQEVRQFKQAISSYQMALSYLDTFNHDRKSQIFKELSDCYMKLGNYQASRELLVTSMNEEKLFINAQMIRNIKELEIKYESTLQQEKINQLELDNKLAALNLANEHQKKQFAYSILLGIILLGGIGFYNISERNKDEKKQSLLNERLRMSSELHDEVGSTLSGISMYSHLAKSQLKEKNEPLLNSIDTIQGSTDEIINKINDIIWMVHPGKDTLQMLKDKLEDYLRKMASIKNIKVVIEENINGKIISIDDRLRKNIYLILKESINNAVKYSEANEIVFKCILTKNKLLIGIEDNGKGFDTKNTKGNGLNNIKNRSKEIGAHIQFTSNLGQGSQVYIEVQI